MSNEAFWIGPCGHSWDIKLGAECPECHSRSLREFSHASVLRRVDYGAIGLYPANFTAALAEIERLKAENRMLAADPARFSIAVLRTERDDLARRLADAENEIAALGIAAHEVRMAALPNPYGDLLPFNANSQDKALHQPSVSQRQAANPAPAADSVAVPDQAGAAGADEVLSDFWDYCSNDVAATLPIGVQRAWLVPQMDGIKAIVARQPSDDLAIPPVPFNALRYSR